MCPIAATRLKSKKQEIRSGLQKASAGRSVFCVPNQPIFSQSFT